jgi:DNA-binding Xre family transcriptional regulator
MKGGEAMNQIERIQADLIARFPGLSIEVDPPALETGYWNLDVRRGDDYLMSVEWRPSRGFGLSTPKPDDYGSGADEVYGDASKAFDRIVHLIETGGETVPPLAVRLAELRQIRGLSQAELAERAGMKQANLSRFENHEDSKISTLEKVVTALGATLSITARFPDGSSWELRF